MADAVVIGSGPNGLAAAITLMRAGLDVELHEAAATVGGGVRSAQLTLPGFVHDVCSSIYPLAVGSPFLRELGLPVEWVNAAAAVAHPFDDGTAVTLERDVAATAAQLGRDGDSYRRLVEPLVGAWDAITPVLLAPLLAPPARALTGLVGALGPRGATRAVRAALASARGLVDARFAGEPARGLFGGNAAHSMLPLEWRPSAAFGLSLIVLGHAEGWPIIRGGAQRLADALAERLRSLGGTIHTSSRIDALPEARLVLADVSPPELLRIARGRVPDRYARELRRFRFGPGAFKLDWALDGPIPWRSDDCRRALTVHLGGTFEEIAASEAAPWQGRHAERPFVLLAQQSLLDETRAPPGKHTAWAYCHVPNGSAGNMTDAIEAQVERFAPGFRDLVLARSSMSPADFERHNGNLVGGDINGGAMTVAQSVFRPARQLVPYRTGRRGLYLCSSSTPPGGGVHGMCGYAAARLALADLNGAQ
ncbi:MAG: NAD(P)/FAD-dependent oxidoreductase [Thermoleophilia bacterium]|nr:NAD(P)/FAD-dependent oxidoreductase [Thermoleophilia bacterium]